MEKQSLNKRIEKVFLFLLIIIHHNIIQAQTINRNAIVLPSGGTTSFVVESGQSYNATSAVGITLRPGVHFKSGSNVVLRIDNNMTGPAAPNNPNDNLELNWTLARSFDASGAVIGETKTFFDKMGKQLQTQTRNIEAGHVFAVEPLYDVGGKQVGSTMSAPINNAAFSYKADFTTLNYRNYGRFTSTSGLPDKSFAPDPLDTAGSTIGSLAYYYSSRNAWERLQDHTNMPYSTTAGAKNGTNIYTVSGGVGQVMKLGGGHEVRQFNVPVNKELDFYNLVRRTYFSVSEIGDTVLVSNGQKMMSVSFDADSRASVNISIDGRTVMTGRGGNDMILKGSLVLDSSRTGYFWLPNAQTIYFPKITGPIAVASGKLKDYFRSEAEILAAGTVSLQAGFYQFSHFDGYDINYEVGLSDVSFTFYDQLGRVRATIPPEGVKKLWTYGVTSYATLASIPFVKTFKYDGRGNLIESTGPDAGKAEMKYSSDGKLRFSQNALQKLTNKFSYTNYDSYGRSIESGEITPSGTLNFGTVSTAGLDAVGTAASNYLTGTRTDVTVINYDKPESIPNPAGYVQDSYFLSGSAVSSKAKYSGYPVTASNLVSKTWYNYDGNGNVVWMVKYVTGLGYKTMDYVYDDLDNVTKSIYQKGTAAETMVHYFEYDKNKRLVAAYTNTTDNKSTKVLHAKYSYYLHGPLKRVELGDKLQGIDYVYGIDGKLKSINNANAAKDPGGDGGNGFAADVFGMNMEYHAGDYNNKQVGIPNIQNGGNVASYSGLINGISWFSKKPSSTDIAPVMNIYKYDYKGQLLESTWGTPNFANASFSSAGDINREKDIVYDGHGNILSMTRIGGGVDKEYSYYYEPNTNKLAGESDYASYGYDEIGRLVKDANDSRGQYYEYNVFNKVTKIYDSTRKSDIIVSFEYDEDGNRVMKKDHRTGAVTWYSYDGNGSLAAIFEQQGTGAIKLKEQPIYGSDRLGIYYRQGGNYQYTLNDHLGNTRVVINRNKTTGGSVDVVYYADYLPFGTEVRSGGTDHRYGYQGLYAERDKETGLNSFELRNYDPILARWLTPDPYGQYDSPYVGMGNNPVSGIDVDGGWSKDNIGINRKGAVVFDDGKADGNLFLVNDDVGKITSLEMLKGNSIQLAKLNVWIGTDQQKIDYVKSQWKFAEGGFDWFSSTNKFEVKTDDQSAFSVDALLGVQVYEKANDMFNIKFVIQDQGLTNTLLSDPYNTRNAISHEKRHLLQSVKVHHGSLVNPTRTILELDAIRYQRSTKTWQNTTEKFKRGIKGYENKFTF
ncbi:RHS repeat domain-containing protein [Sphingobacterium sp. 2149]|uniref:RHS repeat domain-containing protein n=1 Tax=Sphingobacterium sp. 2149 TaxID=2817763 RepID=UPI001AE6441F|nr:RHS repeat-associated core domain-containing protein [Sphingobacterium sp. 2149]MDR6735567.1 RHS repeat-associated protein [Sphingobacterium sp. 2149]